MSDAYQYLLTFINPITLIGALVLVLSLINRHRKAGLPSDLLMTALFCVAVLDTMMGSFILTTGGRYDMRGLMIGLAVVMLGPRLGFFVMLTAVAVRLSIGDPGLTPGLAQIAIAYVAGTAWHHFARNRDIPAVPHIIGLTVLLTTPMLAIMLTPMDRWVTSATLLVPHTFVCTLVGVSLHRYLLGFELKFLRSTEQLREAADTDHLTGLLNRRSLEDKLAKLKKGQRSWHGMAVIYFDLDNFKSINDTHGHATGDAVLQVVSSRLAATFRPEDIFSRLGGDEFAVVLPNLTEAESKTIAERCRRLVADAPIIVGKARIQTSISVGAIWTVDEADFHLLLHLADKALYRAKSRGRNAVAFEVGTKGVRTQGAKAA